MVLAIPDQSQFKLPASSLTARTSDPIQAAVPDPLFFPKY